MADCPNCGATGRAWVRYYPVVGCEECLHFSPLPRVSAGLILKEGNCKTCTQGHAKEIRRRRLVKDHMQGDTEVAIGGKKIYSFGGM